MSFATPKNSVIQLQLGSSYAPAAGSLVLQTGQGSNFTVFPVYVTVIKQTSYGLGAAEIKAAYSATGKSGDTLVGVTVLSGYTDIAFSIGDYIEERANAQFVVDLNTAVTAIQTSTPTTFAVYNSAGQLVPGAVGANMSITNSTTPTVSSTGGGGGGGGSPGGTLGQTQYYGAGDVFAGYTMSGDATINTTTGAITIVASGGVSFGALAFVNAAAAGTLTGTTLASNVLTSSLTTVGTIGTGVWHGTVVGSTYGGTGVNNGASTVTIGGNLVFSGAFTTTITVTAGTTVTLPTSGTLLSTATPVTVAQGGTGDATLTAYAVLCGGTTTTGAVQPIAGLGTVGQVLTSNGPAALPTMQTSSTGSGTVNSGTAGQAAYYAGTGTAVSGAAAFGIGASGQRVDSAIALPSLVAGMAYYDSTQKAEISYRNALTGVTPRLIYSQNAVQTIATTGAQSLINTTGLTSSNYSLITGTNTLGVGAGFWVANKKFRFAFGGYYSTLTTPGNYFFAILIGGNVVGTTSTGGSSASATNQYNWATADLTCKSASGTSGEFDTTGLMIHSPGASNVPFLNGTVGGTQVFGTQSPFNPSISNAVDFQISTTGATGQVTFVVMNFDIWEIG
jgi:hypothetical protein